MAEQIGNPVPGADASNVVAVAAAEAIATVEDPALTPAGRACLVIKKAAARLFPTEERRIAAAGCIRQFEKIMRDRLARCEYQGLDREIERFADQVYRLSLPLPPVDEAARIAPQLLAAGWAPMEVDLLRGMLRSDEKMISCDVSGIHTDRRVLSRRQIRDAGRPAWWRSALGWNQLSWESQFRDCEPIPGEKA